MSKINYHLSEMSEFCSRGQHGFCLSGSGVELNFVKLAREKVCRGRDGGMANDWLFHWESLLAVNVYMCVLAISNRC
jgi:hypothetical protein